MNYYVGLLNAIISLIELIFTQFSVFIKDIFVGKHQGVFSV